MPTNCWKNIILAPQLSVLQRLPEQDSRNANHCPSNNSFPKHIDPRQRLEFQLRDKALRAGHLRVTPHSSIAVMARLGADRDPLSLHARVRRREFADVTEDVKGFLVSAFCGQPSRREWQEVQDGDKGDREEDREEEWQTPTP